MVSFETYAFFFSSSPPSHGSEGQGKEWGKSSSENALTSFIIDFLHNFLPPPRCRNAGSCRLHKGVVIGFTWNTVELSYSGSHCEQQSFLNYSWLNLSYHPFIGRSFDLLGFFLEIAIFVHSPKSISEIDLYFYFFKLIYLF